MHICIYAGRLACNIFGVKPLKSIIYSLFDRSGKLKTFFAPSECTTHTHLGTFTTLPESSYIQNRRPLAVTIARAYIIICIIYTHIV